MEKSQVRELLLRQERARKQLARPKLLELGLMPGQGQARLLECLLKEERISQRELANRCQVDVTTMSRSLDRLEEAGYLCREKNPSCRRSYQICLTDKGREQAVKTHQLMMEMDDKIRGNIGEEEMEAFCQTLEKICRNLEA